MASLLDDDARARIRQAARRYLVDALHKIETARSFPIPFHETPWMDEVRIINVLGGDRGSPLAEAIEAERPELTNVGSRFPQPDGYAQALLRAVIAAATVEGRRPSATDELADACINELLESLATPDKTVRLISLVTDLDVTAVAGSTVHRVRLEPVRRLDETLSRHMKEAAAAIVRLHVARGSREPRALVIADAVGPRDDWDLARDASPHLHHVLTAIRLATAATTVEVASLQGEPGMVHAHPPYVSEVDPEPGTWWRRVGALDQAALAGIETLAATVCDLEERPPQQVPSVTLALHRFNRSHRPAPWQDRIVDLAIGLEAALSSGEVAELSLTLRSRAAHLLAVPGDAATEIFTDVGDLTTIRGKIVHGSVVPERIWTKLFARRGADQVFVQDRLEFVTDRWRDLLRRAILARLMLGETGGSPAIWPLLGSTSIDGTLVGPAGRRQWRQAIRERAAAVGLTDAWRRAIPLRDYLHDHYYDTLDH